MYIYNSIPAPPSSTIVTYPTIAGLVSSLPRPSGISFLLN